MQSVKILSFTQKGPPSSKSVFHNSNYAMVFTYLILT